MMHDWNVTENFIIWMDLPLVFSMEQAMAGEEAFGWQPDAGARLGVMPRDGGNDDITWYEVDPCFVFHPFNAHEEGENIVLNVCRQPTAMAKGFNDFDESAVAYRWTIDTVAGSVKEEQLDDRWSDFPRVDDRLIGQPARYGYSMALNLVTDGVQFGTELYKYDFETGESWQRTTSALPPARVSRCSSRVRPTPKRTTATSSPSSTTSRPTSPHSWSSTPAISRTSLSPR